MWLRASVKKEGSMQENKEKPMKLWEQAAAAVQKSAIGRIVTPFYPALTFD
jgi:hypothetical protein